MESPQRAVTPPSGMAAPTSAVGPHGEALDLVSLAQEAVRRYYAEYTDEDARYGAAGRAWCQHDKQHLLNWAAQAAEGFVDLDHEVAWLARVLEKRDFPLDRLARSLDLSADVVREQVADGQVIAAALDGSAAMIRARGTFLS